MVLAVVALTIPILPLARRVGRRPAIAAAAVALVIARLSLSSSSLPLRYWMGAVGFGAGALLLVNVVGYVERRAVSVSLIAAVVLDQVLRLAGWGQDASLQAGWVPVQVVLTLAFLAAGVAWFRSPAERADPAGLERRSGGLRLRGGIALGTLLFLEFAALGSAIVLTRWAGVSFSVAAITLAAAGALALLLILRGLEPDTRTRAGGAVLACVTLGGVLAGSELHGPVAMIPFALGHTAALLLLNRALAPAGGRRGGGTVAGGLALLIALYVIHHAAAPAEPGSGLLGIVPFPAFVAAGILLVGSVLVLPRPEPAPPLAGWPLSIALAVAVIATAAALAVQGQRARAPVSAVAASSVESVGARGCVPSGRSPSCRVFRGGAEPTWNPGQQMTFA